MNANALEIQIDTWNRLDSAIPLDGASHDEVARYSVETIWRKAECIATLFDGRRVKLLDAWQFVGYTGRDPVRSLLFCHEGEHIELQINASHEDELPLPAGIRSMQHGGNRFTATDGSLTTIARQRLTVLRNGSHSRYQTPHLQIPARVTR